MQDTEPGKALSDLGRCHRRAVVTERRSRQAALLQRLGETMSDDLGRLGQIPLQVTGEPRAIIDNAKQDRRHPFAACGQHLARAMVAVPMPEPVDVLGLVAADLAIDDAGLRAIGAIR